MKITREIIDILTEANPGGCIAYQRTKDGMKSLGFSTAITESSGYTKAEMEQIVAKDPFALIYEEDKEHLKKMVEKCFSDGEDISCGFRITAVNGKQIWALCRGKLIGELDGEPVMFATIQNTSSAENQIDLVNHIPTGLGIFTYEGKLKQVFLNDGFYEMLGVERKLGEPYLGENAIQGIHPEDREKILEQLEEAIHGKEQFQMQIRVICASEQRYSWVQLDAKLLGAKKGVYTFYASFINVDRMKRMENELKENRESLIYAAEHDELTGIYNRKKAYAESEKLLAAHPDEVFAIVHFDLQRFRLYNSFFGEEEGDRLLIYIADMFRTLSKTHKYGVYGRIEADVFFLCFPFKEEVIRWNEQYIHKKLLEYRSDFMLAGSSGVYIAKNSSLSVEAMFNRAMEAGKSIQNKQLTHVAVYDDSMEKRMLAEHIIAGDMRRAIENREFVVYLQPKYSTVDGKPYGAEALVRWIHPEKGLVPPNDFIPLFERNGFIISLDQYMWESVCILIRKWLDEGRNVGPISVNVSRVSMYNPGTVDYLKGLVRKYRIPAGLLDLELTESAYMEGPDELGRRLEELQDVGFEIMMDDFGSGYSSLNTLREMTFNYLKVDRMLLVSIEQDERSKAVLTAIIRMAGSIHIPVIAEGVETEEQKEFLKGIGCDYIQGFLYARPMPVEEYEEKIL